MFTVAVTSCYCPLRRPGVLNNSLKINFVKDFSSDKLKSEKKISKTNFLMFHYRKNLKYCGVDSTFF